MKTSHKIRLAAFTAMLLFLLICSASYVREAFGVLYGEELFPDTSEHIYIDGADFGTIFSLMAAGVGSLISLIIMASYFFAVIIGNIIFFLIFRLVSLRKTSAATEHEYRISVRINIICSAAVFIINIIMTGIFFAPGTLLLFWQPPLFAYLLYLRPLRSKSPQDDDDNAIDQGNTAQ